MNKVIRTLTTVLEGFPDHPYGELFPGGDTTGREEAAALLQKVKTTAGDNAKTKKKPRKRQQKN